MLQDLQGCSRIHGIAIHITAPAISHLFFADDTLLFGHATEEEAHYLKFAIQTYKQVSGQQINYDKSGMLFSPNTHPTVSDSITRILGMSKVDIHGKYLGLPSVIGLSKREIFNSIKDRVWKRLKDWKARNLSRAGKEILIKAVIQSIPAYAVSCFRIPDGVLDEIQSMASAFWWGDTGDSRKIRWVAWDNMCQSKSHSGIGFRNLKAFNLAMLSKQAWKIFTNPTSLLARVLKAKYFPITSFLEASLGNQPSCTWRSILEGQRVVQLGARML